MQFTLDDLTRIAREAIGDPRLALVEQQGAGDIAGWDSLNHTIITMAIAAEYGIELRPKQLGAARNFGEAVQIVNKAIDGR